MYFAKKMDLNQFRHHLVGFKRWVFLFKEFQKLGPDILNDWYSYHWICKKLFLEWLTVWQIVTRCVTKHLFSLFISHYSITKERNEVIILGTHSEDPHSDEAEWLEYEFKCKPGNLTRRPCLITPYHYRLDWLMWFAAFQVSKRTTVKVLTQFCEDYFPTNYQCPPFTWRFGYWAYQFLRICPCEICKI